MSKPIVDGKKHISEKAKPTKVKAAFSPRSVLDVPEFVHKDCESKDLEYRWVDAKQMGENGNMHKNYWEIYRRPADSVASEGALFGLPPDGTIRRGTLLLAVRPKETGDGHRQILREKSERQSQAVKKQGAEFRRMAREAGVTDRVIDETEIS